MKGKRKVLFKLNETPLVLLVTDETTEELQNLMKTIMYEIKTMDDKEEILTDIDTGLTSFGLNGRVIWFYKDEESELDAIGMDEVLNLNDFKRKENTCVSLNCPFVNHCKDYNFLVDRGDNCEIQTWFLEKAKCLMKEQEDKR